MKEFKTLDASLEKTINGLGIIRCEEKEVDEETGKVCGHTRVWYDICLDCGEGDIIDSRKTLEEATRLAKQY